jgi:hypothetical protein
MAWDWKLIGILTDAALDYRPQYDVTSSTLGWSVIAANLAKGGAWQGSATARLLTKICHNMHQNIIFEVMADVQKDSEDAFAEIVIFFN